MKLLGTVTKQEVMQRLIVLFVVQCPTTFAGHDLHTTVTVLNRNGHLIELGLQELGSVKDQFRHLQFGQVGTDSGKDFIAKIIQRGETGPL